MKTKRKPRVDFDPGQFDRICACGHSAAVHLGKPGTCAHLVAKGKFCPCPAFTPKKEEKR